MDSPRSIFVTLAIVLTAITLSVIITMANRSVDKKRQHIDNVEEYVADTYGPGIELVSIQLEDPEDNNTVAQVLIRDTRSGETSTVWLKTDSAPIGGAAKPFLWEYVNFRP